MTTTTKTRWMRVNGCAYTINHPVINGRHYYCLSVGRYGEICLHWQELTDGVHSWINGLAYDESGNVCERKSCELANAGEQLINALERYTDKSGAERVAYCLDLQAKDAAIACARCKLQTLRLPEALTTEIDSLIVTAVNYWAYSVLLKCDDNYLSRYGI